MTRRAFTTVELCVALVVGGVVAAAIVNVLRRQQRYFVNAASVVEQRVSLRDATGILPAEIRALAPADGDVIAFSDTSLDIRATIGTAIACDTVSGGRALDLTPVARPGTPPLSAYAAMPQPGDVALVFDEAAAAGATTGAWVPLEISDVAPSGSRCAASPFGAPGAGSSVLQLRFVAAARVPDSVRPGAFVRLLRRVRYRFYRASTNDWYLGYAEWEGTAFGIVQPVSGPFAPYSRQRSGLTLRYLDTLGTALIGASSANRIARIEVVVRGSARAGLAGQTATYTDSQSVGIRVRNQ